MARPDPHAHFGVAARPVLLIAVAIIDPRLAATFARLSFLFIGFTGTGLIVFLALRGQDRALSLIPTWILFLVWIFGAGVALTGKLAGEVVMFGLVSGLVLILLSIGFTVTQYAFRSIGRCTARHPPSCNRARSPSMPRARRCGNGMRAATRSRSARL